MFFSENESGGEQAQGSTEQLSDYPMSTGTCADSTDTGTGNGTVGSRTS